LKYIGTSCLFSFFPLKCRGSLLSVSLGVLSIGRSRRSHFFAPHARDKIKDQNGDKAVGAADGAMDAPMTTSEIMINRHDPIVRAMRQQSSTAAGYPTKLPVLMSPIWE